MDDPFRLDEARLAALLRDVAERLPQTDVGRERYGALTAFAHLLEMRILHLARPLVIQPWVSTLPFMQQTVLLTALRGADGLSKRHVSKYLLRWLRRCVLYSAFDRCVLSDPHDPRGGNFTGPLPVGKSLDDIHGEYLGDVDTVPHHFHLHLVHAAEILGYKHPASTVREGWNAFYCRAVRDMHLHPETATELDFRLGDSQRQWQEAGGEHLEDRSPR